MTEDSEPGPRGSAALMADVALSLAFMTRLPVTAPHDRSLARAAWAFPVAGWVVGAVGGAALWLAAKIGLPPLGCAVLGVAAAAWISGGLHEDGLADLADGLGAGGDAGRSLEVMRDSRIGSFGVLALIFAVGAKVAALAGMMSPGSAFLALVAAHGLSRALVVPVMWLGRPARGDGLGHGAGRPTPAVAIVAVALGGIAPFALLAPSTAFWMLVFGAVSAAVTALLAVRRLGGTTGDVLGAAEQVAEAAALLAAARAVF